MGKIRFWLWQIFGGVSVKEVEERCFDHWIAFQFFLAFVVVPAICRKLYWVGQRSGLTTVGEWLVEPRVLSEAEKDRLLGVALATFVFVHIGVAGALSTGVRSRFFFFALYLLIFVVMSLFLPFVKNWSRDGVSPIETVFSNEEREHRAIAYGARMIAFFFAQEAWLLFKCFIVLGSAAVIVLPRFFFN